VAAAEWVAGHWFDAVVAATDLIGARFPARRTAVVRNYSRIAELQRNIARRPYAERAPIALFTGGLTPIRCAEEICVLSDRLRDVPGFETIVVGRPDTVQYPAQLATRAGWDRVRYEGIVPMSRVRELLGEARVALCLNQPREDYLDLATNKLFEYMAVGLPVVSTDIPYWRKLIEQTGCGIVVQGADAEELADAVRWLLEHPSEAEAMGARGRVAAESHYNWTSEERTLLSVYARVLS
jgi:glycosyltransferase involved in cell wall biosynthesis